MKRIAIIGGGFSGISVAAHLISKSSKPFQLYLIDKNKLGKGVAYSTRDPHHFLNVRAINMSAFEEDREHFWRWLQEHKDLVRSVYSSEFASHSYFPRLLYGHYLEDVLERAKQEALTKKINFHIIQDEVVALSKDNGNLTIEFKQSPALCVNAAVLAVGIPSKKQLNNPHVLHMWDDAARLQECASLSSDKSILLLGSGLTAVDVICTLSRIGFKGRIIALSRSGSFPKEHEHLPPEKLHSCPLDPSLLPPKLKALDLLKEWRKLLRQNPSKIYWKQLIESVRPHIPRLFQRLDLFEKKCFFRHLLSVWNKHRHCMAPIPAKIIHDLLHEGRLELIKGHLERLEPASKLPIAVVIDCSGTNYRIAEETHPLHWRLLKNGIAVADSLGMGFRPVAGHEFLIHAHPPVWTLGGTLFGERFETIAVPELRHQAKDIAEAIVRFLATDEQR